LAGEDSKLWKSIEELRDQVQGLLSALNSIAEIVEACTGRLGEVTLPNPNPNPKRDPNPNRDPDPNANPNPQVTNELQGVSEAGNSASGGLQQIQTTTNAAVNEMKRSVADLENKVYERFNGSESEWKGSRDKLLNAVEQAQPIFISPVALYLYSDPHVVPNVPNVPNVLNVLNPSCRHNCHIVNEQAESYRQNFELAASERERTQEEAVRSMRFTAEQMQQDMHNAMQSMEIQVRELSHRQQRMDGNFESFATGSESRFEGFNTEIHQVMVQRASDAELALNEAATQAKQMQHGFEERLRSSERSMMDKLNYNTEQCRKETQEMIRTQAMTAEEHNKREHERYTREMREMSERMDRGLREATFKANAAHEQMMARQIEAPQMLALAGPGGDPLWQKEAQRWEMEARQLRSDLQAQRELSDRMHSELMKEMAQRDEALRGDLISAIKGEIDTASIQPPPSTVVMVRDALSRAMDDAASNSNQVLRNAIDNERREREREIKAAVAHASGVLSDASQRAVETERHERGREFESEREAWRAAVEALGGVVRDEAMRWRSELDKTNRETASNKDDMALKVQGCLEQSKAATVESEGRVGQALEAVAADLSNQAEEIAGINVRASKDAGELRLVEQDLRRLLSQTAEQAQRGCEDMRQGASAETVREVSILEEKIMFLEEKIMSVIASGHEGIKMEHETSKGQLSGLLQQHLVSSGQAVETLTKHFEKQDMEVRASVAELRTKQQQENRATVAAMHALQADLQAHQQGVGVSLETFKAEHSEVASRLRVEVELVVASTHRMQDEMQRHAAISSESLVRMERDLPENTLRESKKICESMITGCVNGLREATASEGDRITSLTGKVEEKFASLSSKVEEKVNSLTGKVDSTMNSINMQIKHVEASVEANRQQDLEIMNRKYVQASDDTSRAMQLIAADAREQVQECKNVARRETEDTGNKCINLAREEAKRVSDLVVAEAKSALNAAEKAQESAHAIHRQVQTNSSRVDNLENEMAQRIGRDEAHITTVEAKVTSMENTLGNSVSGITGRLGTMEGRISALDTSYNHLSGSIESNLTRIQNGEHRVDGLDHEIKSNASKIAEHSGAINNVKAVLEGVPRTLDQLERDFKSEIKEKPTHDDIHSVRQEIRSLGVTTQSGIGSLETELGIVKDATKAAAAIGAEVKEYSQKLNGKVEENKLNIDKVEQDTLRKITSKIDDVASSIDAKDAATRKYCVDHLGEEFRAMCIMAESERDTAVNRVQKHVDRLEREIDDKESNTQNVLASLRESNRASVAEVDLRNTSRWDCTRQAFQFVGHKLEATDTLNSVLSHS